MKFDCAFDEMVDIEKLVTHPKNNNKHPEKQIDEFARIIQKFGVWREALTVSSNSGYIVCGHGRLLVAKKLGLKQLPVDYQEFKNEAAEYQHMTMDNEIARWAETDQENTFAEMQGFGGDLAISDLGFQSFTFEPEIESDGSEDEVPKAPEVATSALGDVWILGDHRLMCGDSTDSKAVKTLMNGEKADLLHSDPPYGMGKEKDGVKNDNLYAEKLDKFQMKWWGLFRQHLTENAGVYIWGNAESLWRLWNLGGLKDSEKLTFRNEIVWNKGSGQGMGSDQHRMFPTSSERCMFFMRGEQGYNNNSDNYWNGFDPIRKYLKAEREKMGWNNKHIADFFGFHPRMADHWFSTSQWSLPKMDQYELIQSKANGKAFLKKYDEIKKQYDEIKKEFYATRPYFDNTHENMTDVWLFDKVSGSDRHGHATPKPVKMMERVMRSSLPEQGLAVEPFGGSGSTLIGAETSGRLCYTMELDPIYCDVIIKRWQEFTEGEAIHEKTGNTYNSMAVEESG